MECFNIKLIKSVDAVDRNEVATVQELNRVEIGLQLAG